MKTVLIFFVVIAVLGVNCLPSRVRRQFDWDKFETSDFGDINSDSSIRIPRQRGNWGRNPNGPIGRQIPAGSNLDTFADLDDGFDSGVVNGDDFNNGVGNGVTSPSSGGSTTTRAPASYTNCMNNCQFTKQYNPVCGTDGNTYSNRHELKCASDCGRNVLLSRGGTCQPL